MDRHSSAAPLNNSVSLNDDVNNIKSRLRRLRIQEGILLQGAQKRDKNIEDIELQTPDYKNLYKKVRDSYINLKNLFDEIKTNTQSQELLVDLDIDEMKSKIFEMESSIKYFKAEINTELLRVKESYTQINETSDTPESEEVKRRQKTNLVNYNTIVPSPVSVMIKSPFKCSEVQLFQEFMQNSTNRYGGWNEYNHNVFVKYWQKHFCKKYGPNVENETLISPSYDDFIEEVSPKLHEVTSMEINAHINWYSKYLELKEKQLNAIAKWKLNKISLTKFSEKVNHNLSSLPLETTMDEQNFIASNFSSNKQALSTISSEDVSKMKRKTKLLRPSHNIMKPTKQWLNRNNDVGGYSNGYSEFQSIDNMNIRRTPFWRSGILKQ